MEVKGLTPAQFQTVVAHVSLSRYDGNVATDWEDYGPTLLNAAGTRFRGRVKVRDSRGKGARRSWSGRRMPAACWHVFRDVVRATLAQYPGVVFRTAMARYDAATFEATYPATGRVNIGSQMNPVTMPECCECDDEPGYIFIHTEHIHVVPIDSLVSRVDAALSVVAGECGWCSAPTGSDASVWCSADCQEHWQAKYALAP